MGDLREDPLDQARATFADRERLAFVPVDVRDAAVANLVATAEQAFGPPAVTIANAGIVPNASVVGQFESERLVNFSSPPNCGHQS